MKHPESRSENPRTVFLPRGSWGSKIFMSLRKTAARKREGIISAQVAICRSPATEMTGEKVVEEASARRETPTRRATIPLRGMLMNLALNESIPRSRRDLEIQRWWILSRARAQTGLSSRGPRRELWPTRVAGSFPEGFYETAQPGMLQHSSRKLDLDLVPKKRLRADDRFTVYFLWRNIFSGPLFLANLNCVCKRIEGRREWLYNYIN